MPKFFGAWIDKAMPSCVFTATQLKVFNLAELHASPWYIECAKNYALAEEEDEKRGAVSSSTPALSEKAADEDDDAVVEIVEPTSAEKKRQKGKAVKSPAAAGSSRKTKPKSGDVATAQIPKPLLEPTAELTIADRSHCQPSVTSVTFAPSHIQAQNALGTRTHGIVAKVLILNESLISLGEQKLSQATAPAALSDILEFAKEVIYDSDSCIVISISLLLIIVYVFYY